MSYMHKEHAKLAHRFHKILLNAVQDLDVALEKYDYETRKTDYDLYAGLSSVSELDYASIASDKIFSGLSPFHDGEILLGEQVGEQPNSALDYELKSQDVPLESLFMGTPGIYKSGFTEYSKGNDSSDNTLFPRSLPSVHHETGIAMMATAADAKQQEQQEEPQTEEAASSEKATSMVISEHESSEPSSHDDDSDDSDWFPAGYKGKKRKRA
eukprot:g10219.t1